MEEDSIGGGRGSNSGSVSSWNVVSGGEEEGRTVGLWVGEETGGKEEGFNVSSGFGKDLS